MAITPKKKTESKSKYFHSLGELQADQEMEQALKDNPDWLQKQKAIEQAFKDLNEREQQKKKLQQRKDMSDGFRPKESDVVFEDDPRLEKPILHPPAFDNPQDYSIDRVPAEMDVDAPNSFLLAGIHEWVKDGVEAGKKIGEVIFSEQAKVNKAAFEKIDFNINTGFPKQIQDEQDRVDAKDLSRWLLNFDSLETFKDSFMPWLALKDYLVDSAKARMKAVEKRGIQTKGFTGPPSQAEVDAQRTFKPSSHMKIRHKEALDRFVRETGFKDKEKSTESKKEWDDNKKEGESFENYFKRIGKTPWYSLDLNKTITVNGVEHFKYADQWDKNPALFALSKLLGKFNFQVNPNLLPDEGGNLTQSEVKYKDAYDFAATKADTHLTSLSKFFHLGPSKGPPDEWNISRTIPLEQMPATVTTEIPKITKI